MQTGDISHQIIKAIAAGFSGAVQIHTAEPFHNIHMVRNLKIRDLRLSKTFYLYIFAVVLADRNRVVNNIGNDQHPFADLALQLCFLGLEFLQLGSNAGHQPLGLLRFFLFPLGHQRADLLAGYVALVAQ